MKFTDVANELSKFQLDWLPNVSDKIEFQNLSEDFSDILLAIYPSFKRAFLSNNPEYVVQDFAKVISSGIFMHNNASYRRDIEMISVNSNLTHLKFLIGPDFLPIDKCRIVLRNYDNLPLEKMRKLFYPIQKMTKTMFLNPKAIARWKLESFDLRFWNCSCVSVFLNKKNKIVSLRRINSIFKESLSKFEFETVGQWLSAILISISEMGSYPTVNFRYFMYWVQMCIMNSNSLNDYLYILENYFFSKRCTDCFLNQIFGGQTVIPLPFKVFDEILPNSIQIQGMNFSLFFFTHQIMSNIENQIQSLYPLKIVVKIEGSHCVIIADQISIFFEFSRSSVIMNGTLMYKIIHESLNLVFQDVRARYFTGERTNFKGNVNKFNSLRVMKDLTFLNYLVPNLLLFLFCGIINGNIILPVKLELFELKEKVLDSFIRTSPCDYWLSFINSLS